MFLLYRSCISFVKFISKYFIPFDAIMTIFVFLTSFSCCWLLVYRNTTDLYTQIFHPVVLLSSVILIDLIGSLGFSIQKILSSINKSINTLYLFFFFLTICMLFHSNVYMPLHYFDCLVALARISSPLVNRVMYISQGSPEKQIMCVCVLTYTINHENWLEWKCLFHSRSQRKGT